MNQGHPPNYIDLFGAKSANELPDRRVYGADVISEYRTLIFVFPDGTNLMRLAKKKDKSREIVLPDGTVNLEPTIELHFQEAVEEVQRDLFPGRYDERTDDYASLNTHPSLALAESAADARRGTINISEKLKMLKADERFFDPQDHFVMQNKYGWPFYFQGVKAPESLRAQRNRDI